MCYKCRNVSIQFSEAPTEAVQGQCLTEVTGCREVLRDGERLGYLFGFRFYETHSYKERTLWRVDMQLFSSLIGGSWQAQDMESLQDKIREILE